MKARAKCAACFEPTPGDPFCRPCWAALPAAQQTAIWSAWRTHRRELKPELARPTYNAWKRAIDAAAPIARQARFPHMTEPSHD